MDSTTSSRSTATASSTRSPTGLTLDAWVKPDTWTGDFTVISKGDHQYALKMSNANTLEFFVHSGTWRTVRATVPADFYGNWHRVTGTFDGTKLRLLIDGHEVATTDYTGTIDWSHWPVNIGRNAETMQENVGTRMAHGSVDQVRIYHRALTDAELAQDPKTTAVLALDFETAGGQGPQGVLRRGHRRRRRRGVGRPAGRSRRPPS